MYILTSFPYSSPGLDSKLAPAESSAAPYGQKNLYYIIKFRQI